MRRNNSRHQNGFTILELLLYISISASVLMAGSLFMATLLSGRVKHQAINEVEQQGAAVMRLITDSLRSAQAVNTPAAGSNGNNLSLDVIASGNDPTLFSLNNGALQITEGTSAAAALTNSRVTVSNLNFQNYSLSGSPGSIQVSFTISHNNPTDRQEYNYAKTFYGTASLRHP